jgi:hypothetical protein
MPTGKAGGKEREGCLFHDFYKGKYFTVVGAVRRNGTCPARDFLDSLPAEGRAKLMALIRRLADVGSITNREQFKKIENTEFFEFKHYQLRMPGYFRPGGVFVLTHGFVKKQDRIPPQELERAWAIRAEYEERGQP